MSLNRNGAPPAYPSEAGRTAYLGDPAGAYAPGGASAPTTDPARAYSGKRATAPTLAAAGAYIPGAAATSSVAEIGDPAGTYGGAEPSAPTIDPAGAYSGSGARTSMLATVGTYLPVAGPAKVVDPARAYSGVGASAATIDPAGALSAPAASAPAPAPAGANIPVSEANSAVAETVDPAGADSPAGAGPAATDPARATLGAGAGAPVLSPAGGYMSGAISAATKIIGPAGALGAARAAVPAADQPGTVSNLSASPDALDPNGAPPGYYYQAGATAYIEDPAGTYSMAGATTPTADPGGTHSGPGASAPTQDRAGTYSSPYALDRLFLETTSATPDNRVLSFNTLTALENYYGATSDEAGLAAEFFTTYGSSANMLVIRFPLGGNRAHLYGADVSNLTLAQLQAINGSLSVTSQGYNYSASINLSGVTSPTLAATAIQAALNQNLPVAAVTTGSSINPVSLSFTASTDGLLLDVTSISSGSIQIGATISGAGIPAGTQINSQFSGTPGGVGVYSLYVPAGVISSETMTESYGELTVGSVSSGTVADGEQVTGAGILPDTAIEENLGGNAWLVDFAQTVSENMTMTGAPLSVLYTAVTGATENSGYFSIQQNGYFNYNTASLTYASGTAAESLGLTQAAGAWLATPGENISSESAFMNSIVQIEGGLFGSVQSTWPLLAQFDPESQTALAEWAQSTDGQFQFLNDTSTAPPAGISTATIDPAGTYSGPGASAPTPAAPGTYIPIAGATSESAEIGDPAGTYSGAGASAATTDPAGTFSPAGASAPMLAAAGTYIPGAGATSSAAELVDPAGSYSLAGASAYTLAQPGYYVPTTGASAPTPADAGTYITVAGATSAAAEIIDPAGSYSLAGASAYTLAQPGYYVPTAGASSETPVDPGYYTPNAGATAEMPAGPPAISGTVAGQTTAPLQSDTPFSSVTIADPNTDTTDTLTIQLTGLGGALADGAGFNGLITSAPGVYTLSGTAAAITSELDGLVFTSAAGSGTTTFTLTDTTSPGTSVSDANTTVTVEPNVPVVVSVSTFLANQSSLDLTPGGSDILDAASEITANLDQLNDPNIDVIAILDNGQVSASVQQLTSDATAIGKLKDANSSPVLLAINDTAADVQAGLSTLVADTGEIASITASDAPVVVSVATFLTDQPTLTLDKIVGGFAISDTAADVAQNLDALNADTNITSIALTDGGVPTLTVSLEQALNDTLALNKIADPHSIVISDSAPASITSTQAIYLSGEAIAVDGAPVIATGTVATMAILAQIVTSLLVSQRYTLAVVDTAANIEGLTIAQINNLALRDVLLLEASDTSVALSAKLALLLEAANMTVTAPSGSQVTLTAPKASINSLATTAIAGLPALGVSSIVSTNGSVAISVAQALALEGADLGITVPAGDTVTMSDLGSSIATLTPSQIAALPARGVSNIAVSNAANLALTVAQAEALETDNLTVTAEIGFSVTISDTAANLESLTASQIDGLTAVGVTGLVSTNADVSYTSAQTAAILSSGLSVSASGSFTVTENFANGDYSVYQGGQLVQQKSVNLDGSDDIAYFDVTGQTYSSYEDIYNTAGTLVADAQDNVDGSGSLLLYTSGLTITSASGSQSVTTGSDTFAINPHSAETITGFVVGDTIDLTSLPYDPSDSSYSVAPGSGPDEYLVTFHEGTSSYSLQFNQSTPVALTEFALNPDANGDTEVTSSRPIATNGVTALLQVGNDYELEAVSTGTGPLLELNGSPVTTGEFPAGWTPVGAVQTATGYEVAFGNPSGEFEVWNVDGNGNYVSAAALAVSGTSNELAGVEGNFGENFAGAGVLKASPSQIAANSVTTLNSVGNLYELTPVAGGTEGPLLELNGTVVTQGQFPAGWTPVGALWTGDGYEVAFGNSASHYVVWNTDVNGNFTSAATGILTGTSPELEGVEAAFGDGTFALAGSPATATPIVSNTTTTLAELEVGGVSQNGDAYELNSAGGAGGPLLELNGSVVTKGQFPAGYTPVGAMKTGDGYEVAFGNGANQYVVWNTDVNGNFTGAATGVLSGASVTLQGVEANFGDGTFTGGASAPAAVVPIVTGALGIPGATTLAQLEVGISQAGDVYELNPAAGGTGPLIELNGSAVTAGQFPAGWTPVGAVQTDTGYQVAWSLLGQDTYVVWNTDSNGDYTSAYTAGQVSGQNFTLEDLNPVFGENLNGASSLSAFLVTAPTGPGDEVNLSGQNQNATVNLGANSAFASNGLNAANPTFSGTPYAITLGPQADIIEYALAPGSGIETVATFNLSQDELNIAMGGAPNSALQFDDVTVNSAPAVSIFNSADPAHGLVLLNPGENAAALQAHTTFIGGHALIS